MEFETIKKKNKTKIIVGAVVLVVVTSVVMFVSTRAKYKSVQSIKLANGIVDYKAPDLKLAIKVSEDGVNYTSNSEIPTGNYTFNAEKSKCRIPTSTLNGENAPVDESVTIEYVDGKLNFRGLTHNDTKCYVYFNKKLTTPSQDTLTKLNVQNIKEGTPDFTQVATGAEAEDNNGVYVTNDPMYGENAETYYWRGATTTNHVIFDNKCWRIVRINGDGSIRIIYNGTPTNYTCPGNGNSEAVIMGSRDLARYYATSNGQYNNPSYVGWTYTLNSQRTTNGIASNAKYQTEYWYNENMSAEAKEKIDKNAKFCGDRNIGTPPSDFTWNTAYTTSWTTGTSTGDRFAYRVAERVFGNMPTLICPTGDIYSLTIGAITADEVMFAGGRPENNTSYYLNAGQNYWTMSPYRWTGSNAQAVVFVVQYDGYLSGFSVDNTPGLRPVINLLPNTLFNAGSDGTQNNPYIVQ